MTSIAVYHGSVPNKKSAEKINLLLNFSEGAKRTGDLVFDYQDHNYRPSDVAIIQGWVAPGTPESKHLILRNTVIQQQLKNKKYVIGVDSNLFLYNNTSNPMNYLRYSFNGIFPTTGIYCDTDIDPSRWKSLSKNLNLSLKDYRKTGDHILLLLQRNGGWSMGGVDVQDWAVSTIEQIRQYSDRPIVIRAHPGDRQSVNYLNPRLGKCKIKFSKRVTLSFNTDLVDDLEDCWAAINYNSSPVVGAAIEGVPIFVTDPAKSQCAEIANLDLTQIENPVLHDRQNWVERLSMFHWNFDELRSGECWTHMRKFIKP
jgi:hypothetical protein